MIEAGISYSATDVKRAEYQREQICNVISKTFEKYDILITPTTAVPAFGLGMMYPPKIAGKGVSPVAWMSYTYPFNMTGNPAASLPCGWSSEGLPIGMQIIGKRFDDLTVLQVSKAFENISPWQDKKPQFN
ncbi:Acylamidase [subsurface metagenome]